MARVVLGMTMSLDGFINDRRGSVGALYPDLDTLRNTEPLQEAIHNTGAVVITPSADGGRLLVAVAALAPQTLQNAHYTLHLEPAK